MRVVIKMGMTAKDFRAIAEIINTSFVNESLSFNDLNMDGVTLAHKLCNYFATTNVKFDRERFLVACGCGSDHSLNGVEE